MRGLDDGRARRSGHTPPLHTHSGDYTRLKLLSMGRVKAVRLRKGKSAVLAPWSWPGFRARGQLPPGGCRPRARQCRGRLQDCPGTTKNTEEPMSIDRRHVLLSAVAVSLAGAAPALAASADEEAVAKNVEDFRQAQFTADAKALDALTAPELSYSHSSG